MAAMMSKPHVIHAQLFNNALCIFVVENFELITATSVFHSIPCWSWRSILLGVPMLKPWFLIGPNVQPTMELCVGVYPL